LLSSFGEWLKELAGTPNFERMTRSSDQWRFWIMVIGLTLGPAFGFGVAHATMSDNTERIARLERSTIQLQNLTMSALESQEELTTKVQDLTEEVRRLTKILDSQAYHFRE
jgi:hypothetical protein